MSSFVHIILIEYYIYTPVLVINDVCEQHIYHYVSQIIVVFIFLIGKLWHLLQRLYMISQVKQIS